jgi:hypothetical protein
MYTATGKGICDGDVTPKWTLRASMAPVGRDEPSVTLKFMNITVKAIDIFRPYVYQRRPLFNTRCALPAVENFGPSPIGLDLGIGSFSASKLLPQEISFSPLPLPSRHILDGVLTAHNMLVPPLLMRFELQTWLL